MARIEALVTPSVMRWARERAGFTIEIAAKKIGRSIDEIISWETGESKPTIPQARKASEVYKRPLAVFYLPKPPKDFDTLRDFRSLPSDYSPKFSPELSLLVRTTQYRMEWMQEFLQSEGLSPLPFVGSISVNTLPIKASQKIIDTLQLSPNDQIKCRSRDEALRMWIEKAEMAGIYVFRKGQIDLKEVRGFVLCNEFSPFIYINSEDAQAAQLFTLAHELAHLWLNESGISNLELIEPSRRNDSSQIEIYCNKVASELVLNRPLFEFWLNRIDKSKSIYNQIEELSGHFKVSEEVIARRMLNDGLLSPDTYDNLRQYYQDRWVSIKKQERLKMKTKDGGPSYYRIKAFNNGYSFTQTIVSVYESGSISGREASSLLDVKINNIRKLAKSAGMNFL